MSRRSMQDGLQVMIHCMSLSAEFELELELAPEVVHLFAFPICNFVDRIVGKLPFSYEWELSYIFSLTHISSKYELKRNILICSHVQVRGIMCSRFLSVSIWLELSCGICSQLVRKYWIKA